MKEFAFAHGPAISKVVDVFHRLQLVIVFRLTIFYQSFHYCNNYRQIAAGEIVLEKLIETLMVIALEHAGDERRLLILPHGEELRIAAEARRDRGPTARCVGDALRLARLAPSLCNSNSGERDSG